MRTQHYFLAALALVIGVSFGAGQVFAKGSGLRLTTKSVSLEFGGQYRARFSGTTARDFKSGTTTANIAQRARLRAIISYKDRIRFMLQFQDLRTWGDESNTLGDFSAAGFDIHQGWLAIRLWTQLYVKIGRQEVNLDNQRLIGAVNWSMQGRSFDGVLIGYSYKWFRTRIFYSKVGERDSGVTSLKFDKDFGFVWANFAVARQFKASLLYAIDTDYAVKRVRHTTGLFATGKISGFKYQLEGYGQFGEIGKLKIRAFMAALKLSYNLSKAQAGIRMGFDIFGDYLSGDGDTSDTTTRAFDTLFATNHKFYGFMDFFLNVPVHAKARGLIDIGAALRFEPVHGLWLKTIYHYFRTAKTPSGSATLGHEIDVVVAYRFFKYIKCSVFYGILLGKSGFETLRGGSGNEHIGYVTVDFKY